MAMRSGRATWSVAEAKAKFSEVVERALHEGPQHVTRNGRKAIVVVSEDDWDERPNHHRTALDLMRSLEIGDEEPLVVERIPFPPRPVDL